MSIAPLDRRPAEGDYAPYYARYVGQLPTGTPLLEILAAQHGELQALMHGVPEERAGHRYAPGKWTIRESLLHVADTERVFAYRLLRIARGDTTPLPGFDQDAYVPISGAERRTLRSIADEQASVRAATLALLGSLDDAALDREGTASNGRVTARGLAYIIAGHERHHLTLFRERYLATDAG